MNTLDNKINKNKMKNETTTTNTCENCIFWSEELLEKGMGKCNKAHGEKIELIPLSTHERGITLRNVSKDIVVLFGRLFGCIYFKKK